MNAEIFAVGNRVEFMVLKTQDVKVGTILPPPARQPNVRNIFLKKEDGTIRSYKPNEIGFARKLS